MLVAIAFLCITSAVDCEREAVARAVVGQGATPMGCLMDGEFGAAANVALAHGDDYRLVIKCRPKTVAAIPQLDPLSARAECSAPGC